MEMEKLLDYLHDFGYNVDFDDFEKIFGNLGLHLWRKFILYEYNLLKFWKYLDPENRLILARYLEQPTRIHEALV